MAAWVAHCLFARPSKESIASDIQMPEGAGEAIDQPLIQEHQRGGLIAHPMISKQAGACCARNKWRRFERARTSSTIGMIPTTSAFGAKSSHRLCLPATTTVNLLLLGLDLLAA